MPLTFKLKLSGLTLIELIVSIGILTLLLGVSIPSFRSGTRNRQLDLTSEAVKDAVILARTNILSPDRSKSSASLAKMTFKITDKSTYQVVDGQNQPILNNVLPADLNFSPTSIAIDFMFDGQGSPSSPTEFNIKSIGGNKSRIIRVSPTGTVEVIQ